MEKIIAVFLVCIMPIGYGYIIYFLLFKNKRQKGKIKKNLLDEEIFETINPSTGFKMNGALDRSGKLYGESNSNHEHL